MRNRNDRDRSINRVNILPFTLGLILTVLVCVATGWTAPPQGTGGNTLRVDVNLVTLEVIAQDKKGNPILGLKKEDFKVYEDGKQQQVVTFDMITDKAEEPMPVSLKDVDESGRRGKVVLILFDDSNITSAQTKVARDAAEKYVKQHMRPWDFFAVATYGLSLKISQNFSHDADKVVAAIREPAMSHADPTAKAQVSRDPNQAGVPGQQRGRQDRMEQSGNNPMMDQQSRFRSTVLLRTLGQLAGSMSRVKGRKSVLLFSEDFAIPAEIQTELRNAIFTAQRSNVAFYSIDARGLNLTPGANSSQSFLERTPTSSNKSSLMTIARRLFPAINIIRPDPSAWLPASLFQNQGKTGGGQTSGGQTGGQTGGQSGGQTGGQTGGQSGGQTGGTTGGTRGGFGNDNLGGRNPNDAQQGGRGESGQDPRNQFEQFQQQSIMDNILRSLSSETGGLPVFNTNNLNQGLDKIDLELSNYYVLGFNSNNPKRDGKYRKLEVKTDTKGAKLKYRNGYADPRPPDALAGSKGERSLLSAISSPSTANQLPLVFRPVYFYETPQLARIPISAKIKKGTVELKKKGQLLVNNVDVMGVAYAEDGSVAARFSETMNLAVEKDKEEAFRGADIPYRNYIKLRPGKYQLKLAVGDDKGKIGTSEQALSVPPMPESGLVSSSLVVSQEVAQLPELIRNIQAQLLDETDPLIYKGVQILPSVENHIRRESPIAIFYKLYNLNGTEPEKALTAKAQLSDEKGEITEIPPINLREAAYSTGTSEMAVGFNLPLKELNPGKYRLSVETSDSSKNQKVTTQVDLVLE